MRKCGKPEQTPMPQAAANGLQLEYEALGDPANPAILLIMGLGWQMVMWPQEFCEALARAGFYVIRYDNRDVGLSTKLHTLGKVRLLRAGLRAGLGLPVDSPYSLDDMADDAAGLLDALGIGAAHLVGVSMGGMIAQLAALRHPDKVLSLTSIMSHGGGRRVPQPGLRLRLRLVRRPSSLKREDLIRHGMETLRLIGSPGYPTAEPERRALIEHAHDRSSYPRGMARQMAAILAAPGRGLRLAGLKLPTLIIHGKDDPLVPVGAAYDLARHMPAARLEVIPGMGHDLPAPLVPRIAGLIIEQARGAQRRRRAA
jgi:pimeloyl-ACP methyl ester carboxylesterase